MRKEKPDVGASGNHQDSSRIVPQRGGLVAPWWGNVIAAEPRFRFTALRVAALLSEHRNYKTGECFWSQLRIAQELGLHRNRVGEAVELLQHVGIVSIRRRYRDSSVYTLNFDRVDATAARVSTTQVDATAASETTMIVDATAPKSGCPVPRAVDATADRAVTTYLTTVNNDDDVDEIKDDGEAIEERDTANGSPDAVVGSNVDALVRRGIAQSVALASKPEVAAAWLALDDWDRALPTARNSAAVVTVALRAGQMPDKPRGSRYPLLGDIPASMKRVHADPDEPIRVRKATGWRENGEPCRWEL